MNQIVDVNRLTDIETYVYTHRIEYPNMYKKHRDSIRAKKDAQLTKHIVRNREFDDLELRHRKEKEKFAKRKALMMTNIYNSKQTNKQRHLSKEAEGMVKNWKKTAKAQRKAKRPKRKMLVL